MLNIRGKLSRAQIPLLLLTAAGLYHGLNIRDVVLQTGDGLAGKLYLLLFLAAICGALCVPFLYRGGDPKKMPMHRLFFVSGLFLGTLMLVVTPGLSAPDEMSHYSTAYRLSSRLLGMPELTESAGLVAVRAEDYPLEDLNGVKTPEIPEDMEEEAEVLGNPLRLSTYRAVRDWDRRFAGGEELLSSALPDVRTTPVMYLPQAFGFAAARLLRWNAPGLLALGKFLNLLCFLLLATAAIRLAPVGKELIFGTALLPMSLHLAASLSYDAGILGTAFLFIGEILYLCFGTEKLRGRALLLLCVLAAALGPCKMVYSPVVFLFLAVPASVCGGKKRKALCFGAILCSLMLAMVLVNGTVIRAYAGASAAAAAGGNSAELEDDIEGASATEGEALAEERILPEEDTTAEGKLPAAERGTASADIVDPRAGYTVSELLGRPLFIARMVLNTFSMQSGTLIGDMIGMRLGNLDPLLGAPGFAALLYMGGLLLLTLRQQGENERIPAGMRLRCLFVCAAVLLLTAGAMLVSWTSREAAMIEGIQGRYFLPVLPAALLVLPRKYLAAEPQLRIRVLGGFVLLDLYVILRVFSLACMRV